MVKDSEPTVPTVLGEVSVSELGTTLMHEHIFMGNLEMKHNYPGRWDDDRADREAVEVLREVRSRQIETIVDLTALGLGRDVRRLANIAEQVDTHIVVATGLYSFNDVPTTFRATGPNSFLGGDDELVELFVADLESGIGDTGIRAGILKCATGDIGVTSGVDRILRATAAAHRITGAPITTHADAATRRGLDQQRVLATEGVDLNRVIIGHCGDTTDLAYLTTLVENGSYVGMDRFGMDVLLPLRERIETVAELCRRGFAERVLLSHDAHCSIDWAEGAAVRSAMPNWTMTCIPDLVVPALLELGVTEEAIATMLVANPRRIFSSRIPYGAS